MNYYPKPSKRLYKKIYLIALYDEYDNLFGVYDNASDLARAFNINVRNMYCNLGRVFNGTQKTLFGYIPHFINSNLEA